MRRNGWHQSFQLSKFVEKTFLGFSTKLESNEIPFATLITSQLLSWMKIWVPWSWLSVCVGIRPPYSMLWLVRKEERTEMYRCKFAFGCHDPTLDLQVYKTRGFIMANRIVDPFDWSTYKKLVDPFADHLLALRSNPASMIMSYKFN